MIRLLLAIFICFSFVFGDIFNKFDSDFDKSSKAVKTQLYNELKSIYIKSLVSNDTDTRLKALIRLIKSANALNLDSSEYKSDLDELSNDNKTELKKPKKLAYLLSATKSDNALVLKFNQNINSDDIKSFSLNQDKNFRNIVDVAAILNGSRISYRNFLVDEIVIAQNNKQTIRIVFRDKTQKSLNLKVQDDTLLISTSSLVANENLKQTKNQKSISKKDKVVKNRPKKIISKTIVIDPGHGGSDPGAINGKFQEKNAVLQVSKRLGKELLKRGYKVFYTREKDEFINLRSRTKIANDKSADLFISVHANAAPNPQRAAAMRGIETFFLSPARSERSKNAAALENKSDIDEMNFFSKQTFLNFLNREKIIASNKLGIDMQAQILKSIRSKKYQVIDGGVREAPFWVLVGALMPAVLIEIGYITHPEEGRLLFEAKYQEALAFGIANGVDEYFTKNR